ncbi:MAG: ferrochelatase [Cytophagales bacterium]|nr:ferrochelatase [Cytophagales bacterium]MDW8383219.1 ferrochelatase [Flammeovirgaceae bacterium]
MDTTTGVLLVNLGTPKTTSVRDVRRYLREFLMDRRVIDIPFAFRFLLVNGIIAPFRAPKSAKEYKKVFKEGGSPLLYYGLAVRKLLQEALGEKFEVRFGMRYQEPSIESAIEGFSEKVSHLIVLPLFPQYASATSGSVHEKVMKILRKKLVIPKVTFVDSYAEHPLMIETFAELGKKYLESTKYDFVIFSYHGLPERHLKKENHHCIQPNYQCCEPYFYKNRLCYRAQCVRTSRLIAQQLGLHENQYAITFQSRLGRDPWLQPYTDETLEKLASQGVRNLLVFSPAFVADCLETIIEIGETYAEMFHKKTGGHLQLVESLNTHPKWIETLKQIVLAETIKV